MRQQHRENSGITRVLGAIVIAYAPQVRNGVTEPLRQDRLKGSRKTRRLALGALRRQGAEWYG